MPAADPPPIPRSVVDSWQTLEQFEDWATSPAALPWIVAANPANSTDAEDG